MKKGVLLISVLLLLASLNSCKKAYKEVTITDIDQYDTIWNYPERRASEISELFPAVEEKSSVIQFSCRHTTYHLVGTGWQLELLIQYTEDSFEAEKNRLITLCEGSPVSGESKYFGSNAYASVWNWNGCFEYAVVNEEDNTICYIYLQLISKEDLVIDNQYVLAEYAMELEDSTPFSVYFK